MGKKLTHEVFMDKVREKNEHVRRGEIEVRGNFTRTSDRIECYCKKHDFTWNPIAASLYKNIGCKECAKESISDKNSMTHDEFVESLRKRNNAIKVLSEYQGMYEDITVEFECGHTWTTKAVNVYYCTMVCPYCASQRILVGFNDLWTTNIATAKLLTNPEDGYTVTKGSGQKKNFTCSLCGKIQSKVVKNVVNRGLQCSFCGDGISYPNKFCRAFLDQLPINDYEPEWQPEWGKPYLYDNYFLYNDAHYILEADGHFHYSDKNEFGVSLEERQNVDRIKDQLAQEHDITLIRIDCRESNCEYIKNNILNSELNNIFELNCIDWNECDMKAQKTLVKAACDLYVSGMKSTKEISKELKVGINAIISYLKKGVEFGWCNYDSTTSQKEKISKPVIVTDENYANKYSFKSITECEKEIYSKCKINASQTVIRYYCNNGKPYKGFYFRYADITTQN